MVTQLVFEHALRIRMKSDPVEPSFATGPPTESSTTSKFAVPSSPSSTSGDRVKEGKKDRDKYKEDKKKVGEGSNLIGKITNLVSTDLTNIVDGVDFPMLFISLPLQITLCIVFLHQILGWSAIVGMVVMLALYPLLGWIASKMHDVQREKMKLVSHAFSSTSRDSVSFPAFYRRTHAFRL